MALRTDRQRIQHLLRRAGWGASPAEVEEYLRLGLDGAIERLLAPESVDDSRSEALIEALPGSPEQDRATLITSWHLRIMTTRRPLLERMTYFWHDHFATAITKVENPAFMHRQNAMLRRYALGRFDTLLTEVARDPAMMVFLDNRQNISRAPNENYARELMELHTLGRGVLYTEQDIKAAARALTGWRITTEPPPADTVKDGAKGYPIPTGAERVNARFDAGSKTFLGVTGNLDDTDIVRILAARPETARFIGRKLWRALAVWSPTNEMLDRTSRVYFDSDHSIRAVVRTILRSDEMYSAQAYRWRVTSPAEYVLGMLRTAGLDGAAPRVAAWTRAMNQTLYDPPGPQGWSKNGLSWVTSTTALARASFVNDLTRSDAPRGAALDVGALLAARGTTATGSAAAVVDALAEMFLGGDLDEATRATLIDYLGGARFDLMAARRDGRLQGVAYLLLSSPLAQLA